MCERGWLCKKNNELNGVQEKVYWPVSGESIVPYGQKEAGET